MISVEWKKNGGQFILDVTLPEGTDMACEVTLPDGQVFNQTEVAKQYVCAD